MPFFKLVGCGVWGLVTGAIVTIASFVLLVLLKGRDGGRDPTGWAWIDVVVVVIWVRRKRD